MQDNVICWPGGPDLPYWVKRGHATRMQSCVWKWCDFDQSNHLWRIGGFLAFPVFGYREPGGDQGMHNNLVEWHSQSWARGSYYTRHFWDFCEDCITKTILQNQKMWRRLPLCPHLRSIDLSQMPGGKVPVDRDLLYQLTVLDTMQGWVDCRKCLIHWEVVNKACGSSSYSKKGLDLRNTSFMCKTW